MLKILFCAFKYEYGKPELGLSFEYRNFYEVLKSMQGVEAKFFAVDEIMGTSGRDGMNKQLIGQVENQKPDLLFCFLFTEEIKKATINYITHKTATKTFNWFADDHWRFPIFSKRWAPLFTAVSTTDSQAVAKYKSIGINVIKTQWAANMALYKPQLNVSGQKSNVCDITFVGKKYGNRESYINFLKSRQLSAEGYGGGWPSGRVSFEAMLEIFSSSKINLNFTESYFSWPKQLAKLLVKKELGNYRPNIQYPISNIQSLIGARRPQIKGRTFEIPACGGFLLTGRADNLGEYYIEGKEAVVFNNSQDLAEKCKYYLAHEQERKAIALAGYQRTLKEHTYEHRFRLIFQAMGLG